MVFFFSINMSEKIDQDPFRFIDSVDFCFFALSIFGVFLGYR